MCNTGSSYISGGVCGKCLIPLKPKKNGFDMSCYTGDGRYYFTISGDLWECKQCGMQVVLGMNKPFHYQHDKEFRPMNVDAVVQLEPHMVKKKNPSE